MTGPSSERNWHWEEHGREGQTKDEVRLGADGVLVEVRAPYHGPSSERTATRRKPSVPSNPGVYDAGLTRREIWLPVIVGLAILLVLAAWEVLA